jgi:hypothetical protein
MSSYAPKPVRFLGVELGPDGASEWVDRRRVVHVPRQGILGVELRRGIAGERPLLQLLVGGAVTVLGLVILGSLVGVAGAGHVARMGIRLMTGGLLMSLLGGYVLWTGLRPAYYLRVRTADDARKLVLARKVDLAQLSAALRAAEERFGYAVQWGIDSPRPVGDAYR